MARIPCPIGVKNAFTNNLLKLLSPKYLLFLEHCKSIVAALLLDIIVFFSVTPEIMDHKLIYIPNDDKHD